MANETSRDGLRLERLSLRSTGSRKNEVPEADVLGQLLLPEVWKDPYPFYSELRARGVVRHVGSMPGIVFTRHADVAALLRDPRLSNHFPIKYGRSRTLDAEEERIHMRVLQFLSGGWMQAVDGNLHDCVRRRLNPLFSHARVAHLADRIQSTCLRLVMSNSGELMDFISDFAQPLLDDILSITFGLTTEACNRVNRFSLAIASFLGTINPTREDLIGVDNEMHELTNLLVPIIETRRQRPRDDVISALSDLSYFKLSTEEVASQCSLTVAAGLETTIGLLGNSMLAFLRHPALISRVKYNPALIDEAVEECLRYDSPSQWVPRVAREDLRIRGATVAEGELVWLGLGSANRDTAQFPAADWFLISRKPKPLVSFGAGVHYCLGAHLARLEARIALGTVLAKLDHLELDIEEVPYRANFAIRSPRSLPIRFRNSVSG